MRKFKKKCTFLIHKWKNQPQKEFHLFILYRGRMKKRKHLYNFTKYTILKSRSSDSISFKTSLDNDQTDLDSQKLYN
ncbi:hypothetical protein HMPREF0669_02037 [Prevotella sp. oral taxon 299 str. F0039]|nr:hypothetical protein HMPREF0669_02037 [Prevotella sp. oral taxon 299 str. F0039]